MYVCIYIICMYWYTYMLNFPCMVMIEYEVRKCEFLQNYSNGNATHCKLLQNYVATSPHVTMHISSKLHARALSFTTWYHSDRVYKNHALLLYISELASPSQISPRPIYIHMYNESQIDDSCCLGAIDLCGNGRTCS